MLLVANLLQTLYPWAQLSLYVSMFLIWLGVALWVKEDADRRGQNGVVIAFFVSMMCIGGVILWLVIRPKLPPEASPVVESRPPPDRRPPISPERSSHWRIARSASREEEARVIDEAPNARDAELKARAYLEEQPDSFVYVLNPDGSRYRVIL